MKIRGIQNACWLHPLRGLEKRIVAWVGLVPWSEGFSEGTCERGGRCNQEGSYDFYTVSYIPYMVIYAETTCMIYTCYVTLALLLKPRLSGLMCFFSDLSLGLVDFSNLTRFLFVLRIQVLTTSPFFGGQAERQKLNLRGGDWVNTIYRL